jgi:hypothetical protein
MLVDGADGGLDGLDEEGDELGFVEVGLVLSDVAGLLLEGGDAGCDGWLLQEGGAFCLRGGGLAAVDVLICGDGVFAEGDGLGEGFVFGVGKCLALVVGSAGGVHSVCVLAVMHGTRKYIPDGGVSIGAALCGLAGAGEEGVALHACAEHVRSLCSPHPMTPNPDAVSARNGERQSHWLGWTLGLLAVPVVYMLSIPPVAIASTYDTKSRSFKPEPEWLSRYMAPGNWLYLHVPILQKPLDDYWGWCSNMDAGERMP